MSEKGQESDGPRLPLSGVRIVDFTTLLPGPLATLILAEAGAEVTKIERPGGDEMRRLGPCLRSGESALFTALNRGKRIVTLDLNRAADAATARELIADADVLVEQNRPGVMSRLGFGYRELSKTSSQLIYCSITGYGQKGPRANRAGHDLNYLADAGLLMNVLSENGKPLLPPALLADIGGGALPAVLNILLALHHRNLTGNGCHLDISMTDCALTFQAFAFADKVAYGRASAPNNGLLTGQSPRYQLYQARDGRWLAVGALEEKFWRTFCDRIELAQAYRDDSRDPQATLMAVTTRVKERPAAEWLERFAGRDACVSLVRNFDEACADPDWQDGPFVAPVGSTSADFPVPLHSAFRASRLTRRDDSGITDIDDSPG